MQKNQNLKTIELRNWSLSALREFERCGYKAYQSRLIRQSPVWRSIDSLLGIVVHDVVVKEIVNHLNGVSRGRQKAEELLAESFIANLDESVRLVKEGLNEDDYLNIGLRCVRYLYEDVLPRLENHRLLCAEEWIAFLVGRHRFVGRLDLATINEGKVFVHEFKSGSRIIPEQELLEQLATYALGLEALSPRVVEDKEIVGCSHFLRKGFAVPMALDHKQLEMVRVKLERRIEAIMAANDTTPSPNALCDWCGFKPVCPTWNEDTE